MSNFHRCGAGLVAVLLSLSSGASTATLLALPAAAQTNQVSVRSAFNDLSPNYWANACIDSLASQGIISGFSDGSFRPNALVTRAEFATMLSRAFRNSPKRSSLRFTDVPSNHWAANAIAMAYSNGFLDVSSGNGFRPNESVTRQDVLAGLAWGLDYTAQRPIDATLSLYRDQTTIAVGLRDRIAAATERAMVVNYPDVSFLNPGAALTRAEAATILYQALASQGRVTTFNSPYVVVAQAPVVTPTLRTGTVVPVRYEKAEKILLKTDERMPVTFTVTQSLVDRGIVVIPAGSQISGELRPVSGGTQFVATDVVLPNGGRIPLNAVSDVVTEKEVVQRGVNVGTVVKGAVLGGGAATLLGGVTGDRRIRPWQVLTGVFGGAGVGAAIGRNRVELVSVKPENLRLALQSDFVSR